MFSQLTQRMLNISTFKGKKQKLVAMLFGAMATLALPPVFALPFLMISVCGWFLLLQGSTSKKQSFWIGWWWGLGFFISGLYWMSASLLVDAEKFAWMIPFCLIGLNAIIAIYPAITSYVYTLINHKRAAHSLTNASSFPLSSIMLFVALWSASEFARSVLFTGFPWNLVGNIWAVWAPAMQSAAIYGIHGLTLVTMILAISPMLLIYRKYHVFAGVYVIWIALLVWGVNRIPDDVELEMRYSDVPIQLRIVQASIPQTLKWVPEEKIKNLRKYVQLSQKFSETGVDILIWPESAITHALNKEPYLQQDLMQLLPEEGVMITGALNVEDDANAPFGARFYNSIFTLTQDGIGEVYNKHHLVPFGEFVPFRSILPIEKISPGLSDYSRGDGAKLMPLDFGFPAFSPLVCYEAIFSEDVVRSEAAPTQWMVNLTNDGWFGKTSGPYQHLHMTRFRAVEYGMPLVRSANSGISAVVDSYGRITHSLGVNEVGVIDAPLPLAIPLTWFGRYQHWTYMLMLSLLLISSAILSRRFRN